MKKLALLISVLAGLMFSSGCNPTTPYEGFSQVDDLHMQIYGSICFNYTPDTCQLFCSRDTRTFRAGTDTMSEYYEVVLSAIPSEVGQKVSGNVTWTSGSKVDSKNSITLEAVRLEGDRIWLWNGQNKLGAVVRFFD
ncbi:MAG: hypothetical protein Q4F39_04300 [Bacteroidia bacterium]|nr:hypothetical protein [Bacteroidia bacterium]